MIQSTEGKRSEEPMCRFINQGDPNIIQTKTWLEQTRLDKTWHGQTN